MSLYPQAAEKKAAVKIDRKAAVKKLLDLMANGAPKGYKGFTEGAPLSKDHVLALVAAGVTGAVTELAAVYAEIEAEQKAMAQVDVTACKDLDDYKKKLTVVKKVLDVEKWVTGMKEKYGVSTFPELKTRLSGGTAQLLRDRAKAKKAGK